jgi:hypothetical protein
MGIELFERAVKGGAQLLKAETRPVAGHGDRVAALVLTFEVGRIAVSAEPANACNLRIEYVASAEEAPPGLKDASEEEPWWRVLGSPIARSWSAGPEHEGAVCIQFRADDENPRVLTLQPQGGGVSVSLETPPE